MFSGVRREKRTFFQRWHFWGVTSAALVRIQGRKFGIISINERGKQMNNEQNKPTELTEKELEGVVGGDVDLVVVKMRERVEVEMGAVESGDESFVSVSPADNPITQVTAMCYQ